MAVSRSDSGTPNINSAGSVITLSLNTYTVSAGSNLVLLVGLWVFGGTTGTPTVTWDAGGTNQAMTLVSGSPVTLATAVVYLYELVAPAPGLKTLTATWVTARSAALGAIAFAGVDPTTPLVAADTRTNTGTAIGGQSTGAVPSASSDATVGVCAFNGTSLSGTTFGTEVFRGGGSGTQNAMSFQLGGTSNNHTWSSPGSGSWSAMGVHVLAAGTPPPAGTSGPPAWWLD